MLAAPAMRTDELETNQIGEEVIVFDRRTNAIHSLNSVSAAIWSCLDGVATIADVTAMVSAKGLPVTDDVVLLALRQLDQADLLDGPCELPPGTRLASRRRLARTITFGTAALVPAIVSVTASAQVPVSCPAGQYPTSAICQPIAEQMAAEREGSYSPPGCADCIGACTINQGTGCYQIFTSCDIDACDP